MSKGVDLNSFFNKETMLKILYDYIDFVKEEFDCETIFDALNIETQQMSSVRNFIYADALLCIGGEPSDSETEAIENIILLKENAYMMERLVSSGDLEVYISESGDFNVVVPEFEGGE